jgi:uncharacterized protein (UPF0332 family)
MENKDKEKEQENKNKDHEHKDEHETSLEDRKYQNPELKGKDAMPGPSLKDEKEMEKLREKLESLKKHICSTYKFTEAIGIIPPQAAHIFDEENELSEEDKKDKPMHLVVIIPSDKEKEFNDMRANLIKKTKEDKQKIWVNLFLEKDLWEICMDSKYDIIEAIGMAFPLHDKGILGALRVAQIHKSLVLRKFEKYIYSYVVGGSLVRGQTIKTSDVDCYIIIDDTDVKRMPRLELKDKLRNIIYSYVMQAEELSGVKNKLSVQVYLLTEFWDGIKDANPIFYTFLRDGFPVYDRGGFLPWKLLLKMGKIKPSPESIDMFMSMGDKTQEIAKRKLLDIVIGDIYWGVLTPTQALLMLYGLPPTTHKETVTEFRKIFVEKEKMIENKYADILEKVVIKYYKGYEHQKIKEVSGKEVDELLKEGQEYLERLKKLREEIEKKQDKKNFKEIYENVFKMMEALFGKKSENELIKRYQEEIVNKGKGNPKFVNTLKELVNIKKKYNTKKVPTKYEFENLRKESAYLIESLIEYGQRKELGLLEKTKVVLTFKDKHAELILTKPAFLVYEDKIKKITDKIEDSNANEMNDVVADYKGNKVQVDTDMINLLKKELGEFSINL